MKIRSSVIVCAIALFSVMHEGLLTSKALASEVPNSLMVGSTGEQIFTGSQIREMGGKPPKLLTGPEKPDVSALHAQGIQGEMFFSGYVGSDGKMHDVIMQKSSRSDALDAVGLGLVNGSKFTPAIDSAGNSIAAQVVFPVYLWKDSAMDQSFWKKTCSDFTVDADWHSQAYPEEAPDKLRGWLLANGMLFAGAYSNNSMPKKTPSYQEAYDACKAEPKRKFFDILMQR